MYIYICVYIYIYPRYCIHWPLIDVVSHIFTLKTHVLADCFCNHPLLGWVRALHRSTTRSIVALNPQRSPECNWCVAASWTSLNTHILYIYILHISIIYKLHIYHINVYIYIYWFYMDLNSDATAFHLCWKCTVLSLRKSWDLTFSFLLATNLEALKPVIQGYPRRIDGPGILLQPWQPGPIPKTLDVCGFLNFLHRRSELKTNIHGISFISFMLRSPMYSRGMLDIAGHSCKGKDRP